MFRKPKYFNLREEIEDKLTHLDIYQYYIGTKIDKIPFKTKSPLRNEKNPSFGLFARNNKILWKDFTLDEGGDVYKLIGKMFNIPYNKVLLKIKNDMIEHNIMKLNKHLYNTNIDKILIKENSSIIITPYYFNKDEYPKSYYEYWKQYKVITKDILDKNNVKPAKFVYMNNRLYARYKDDDIVIVYRWKRKEYNRIYYKIYRPLNKNSKWLSNFRGSSRYLIHGLNNIDKNVNYIIITKSVKDKMVLEGLGYNAINVQNEGIKIPKEIMVYLQKYYSKIYLLYDNDYNKNKNWGQIKAKELIKEYPFLINIKIDGRYKCTDISEFIKKYDEIKTIKYIDKLLNEKQIS